jgi:molecular chaperone GrpE
LTNHLQRLAAEFENYKKRTAREIQYVQDRGAARVMEAVLPVLDSFDLSLATEPAGQDAVAWRTGLEKINRQLIEALEKLGLHKIAAQTGDALDPQIHEVMFTQPSADWPPDRVLQVFQTGYKLKDRLLRPAKVVVSATAPVQNGETENA